MKALTIITTFLIVLVSLVSVFAQSGSTKKKILVDVSHGQRFIHDPNDTQGKELSVVERAKYITGELNKNAEIINATIAFQKAKFTAADLKDVDILFLQGITVLLDKQEIDAIRDYVKNGGALFVTMDEDFWGTHEQININEIVKPFGIEYKQNNPNQSSGGYVKPGEVSKSQWKIPVHGARIVEGGTSFCFINEDKSPFGVYKKLENGGRIVAMGDGMSSLYMNSWEGVTDYQCSQFMQDVFAWLIK